MELAASSIEILGAIYGVESLGKIANTGLQLVIGLPNSRIHEAETTVWGATRAGCDPCSAVIVWQKMAHASTGESPQFLSKHPTRESWQNDLAAIIRSV